MGDFILGTGFPSRQGPSCPHCGRRTVIARIEPDPDQDKQTVLCSYECACGEKILRKESSFAAQRNAPENHSGAG